MSAFGLDLKLIKIATPTLPGSLRNKSAALFFPPHKVVRHGSSREEKGAAAAE